MSSIGTPEHHWIILKTIVIIIVVMIIIMTIPNVHVRNSYKYIGHQITTTALPPWAARQPHAPHSVNQLRHATRAAACCNTLTITPTEIKDVHDVNMPVDGKCLSLINDSNQEE